MVQNIQKVPSRTWAYDISRSELSQRGSDMQD